MAILLLTFSAIILVLAPSLSPSVYGATTISATAFGQSYFFGTTSGNKLSAGPRGIPMNFQSDQQVCAVSGNIPSPTDRLDVPVKLTDSYLNAQFAPWNGSGRDADGRHFYKWNFASMTLSGCGDLMVDGATRMDPQFNLSRKVSPSVITAPSTLVRVTTSLTSRATFPQFCFGMSDQLTSDTNSTLISFSIKSTSLGSTDQSPTQGQTAQQDSSFQVCFNGGAPGGMTVTTVSVWNVTNLLGGPVQWKPLVVATALLFGCLGCSEPGVTVTASPSAIAFDASFVQQANVTMKMGSSAAGVKFDWLSAQVNQVFQLILASVSSSV